MALERTEQSKPVDHEQVVKDMWLLVHQAQDKAAELLQASNEGSFYTPQEQIDLIGSVGRLAQGVAVLKSLENPQPK